MTSLQTFTPSRLVTKKAKKKALDRNENAGSYHQLQPEQLQLPHFHSVSKQALRIATQHHCSKSSILRANNTTHATWHNECNSLNTCNKSTGFTMRSIPVSTDECSLAHPTPPSSPSESEGASGSPRIEKWRGSHAISSTFFASGLSSHCEA